MAEVAKRRRWKWAVLSLLGVLAAAYAALAVVSNMIAHDKWRGPPNSTPASIASLGIDPIEYAKRVMYEEGSKWDEPTCRDEEGEVLPLVQCLQVNTSTYGANPSKYVGCSYWYDPHCANLKAHAFLLSQPDRLARVVDSLIQPCKYLADPKDKPWMEFPEMNRKEEKRMFEWLWDEMMCDSHPDRYPGRVVLTFYGEKPSGKEGVFQIVKPADD